MPFHKKTLKRVKKFVRKTVKKINPFKKLIKALEPKKKTARRPTTSASFRMKPPVRMHKQLPSGARVRTGEGRAPTGIRRPRKVRPEAKRLSAKPFGRRPRR